MIQVKADGGTPTGKVTVSWDGKSKEVRLVQGYAVASARHRSRTAGTHHVRSTYPGTDTIAPSSRSVDVRVIKLF